MDLDTLKGLNKETEEKVVYVSWIKRFGKGRVFYSSVSHNAQSMEEPRVLQFSLDDLQYVVGDLNCDASPIGKPH
ncbi:MAG: type 1 glutamine amidotransferase [Maribacter sp.]|jgi:type 1 glutamine amidotransferase